MRRMSDGSLNSVQAELEASAVRDITAEVLDTLPYSPSNIVMAALYVLAEADAILVSVLQCGCRPCLSIAKVKGARRPHSMASKRHRPVVGASLGVSLSFGLVTTCCT